MRSVWLFLIPGAFLLELLISSGGLPAPLLIQDSQCDQQLRQTIDDPNGYRFRGDRCEGIYIREVGSTTLLVASLTQSIEDFDAASGKPLLVEWTPPGNTEIHVRAQALRHRLYYRMDTVRPAGTRSYTWSTSLLSTFNLRKPELGIVGWTRQMVGNAERDVYVPLRISQKATGSTSRPYQLILLPGVELSEVFISLAPVGRDGRPAAFIKTDEPLGYGFYPADRGVAITLPSLRTSGIYYLGIKAMRRAGGPASAPPIWFYHP